MKCICKSKKKNFHCLFLSRNLNNCANYIQIENGSRIKKIYQCLPSLLPPIPHTLTHVLKCARMSSGTLKLSCGYPVFYGYINKMALALLLAFTTHFSSLWSSSLIFCKGLHPPWFTHSLPVFYFSSLLSLFLLYRTDGKNSFMTDYIISWKKAVNLNKSSKIFFPIENYR